MSLGDERLRILTMALAAATLMIGGMASAQTRVGPDSKSARFNQLRDYSFRAPSGLSPAAPNIFGTAAIGAGVTFYDARFRRVARNDLDHPIVRELAAPLIGLTPYEQLLRAQSAVKARVRWMHDLDNMRVADFWANAGETLERGTGDSEDIAIVTMQVLKAAGFSERNLYLSLGRHRQAGQHVVLVARLDDQFIVIDDRASGPVLASGTGAFTPVLTVGLGKSWLHGRRVAGVSGRSAAH